VTSLMGSRGGKSLPDEEEEEEEADYDDAEDEPLG
jgi:hypothetical protein